MCRPTRAGPVPVRPSTCGHEDGTDRKKSRVTTGRDLDLRSRWLIYPSNCKGRDKRQAPEDPRVSVSRTFGSPSDGPRLGSTWKDRIRGVRDIPVVREEQEGGSQFPRSHLRETFALTFRGLMVTTRPFVYEKKPGPGVHRSPTSQTPRR